MPSASILEIGRNCATLAAADECAALIDAHLYYVAVHRALLRAKRFVMISAWQLDSDVHLLRGEDAAAVDAPVELLELLRWACERNPELEIYILAWDFSPVFAIEREWNQKRMFEEVCPGRIHFLWDDFLQTNASHHQKLLLVDGTHAFAGGMDVCCSRWDTRAHEAEQPLRRKPNGKACKPYHDIQAYVAGPVVSSLQEIFFDRWIRNGGEMDRLAPVATAPPKLSELTHDHLPIGFDHVAISQTRVTPEDDLDEPAFHVRNLYVDAIDAAERLIYIENQYFSSRAVMRAFVRRLTDDSRPKLEVVIILPKGGDTPKEKLALGEAEAFVQQSISRAAEQHGHALALFNTGGWEPDGTVKPTFVHSKLLIVDDRFMTIGSANTSNRSLGLDTELNLSWEAEETVDSIAQIRASLLAEHCGRGDVEPYLGIEGLVRRLRSEADDVRCRLHHYAIGEADDCDPLLSLLTDPARPVDEEEVNDRLDEAWESFDTSLLSSAAERLGIRDTTEDVDER